MRALKFVALNVLSSFFFFTQEMYTWCYFLVQTFSKVSSASNANQEYCYRILCLFLFNFIIFISPVLLSVSKFNSFQFRWMAQTFWFVIEVLAAAFARTSHCYWWFNHILRRHPFRHPEPSLVSCWYVYHAVRLVAWWLFSG